MAHRVVEEVAHSSRDARRPDRDRRLQLWLAEEHLDPLSSRHGCHPGNCVAYELGELGRAAFGGERARLDRRELEKVAHEGSELVHFLADGPVVAGYGLRVVDHTVLERLHHRLDASQGRAEVMGNPGDQLPAALFQRGRPEAALGQPGRRGLQFGGENVEL